MWIREVDFPSELIEAHRAGRLVIFVGAGASFDAPSSLPSFRDLTAALAAEAQAEVTEADLRKPDVFLGGLVDRGFNVHGRVVAHIGMETSRPNRLHRAIAGLGSTYGPLRIVTTNYDLHLATALTEQCEHFEEFAAPALPVGDDFSGLVYLHGRLGKSPEDLIVTDRDFGRAYLRDAWAARFLERMFAKYAVLFVGYSHGDVVMRYLARSLGRDQTKRYVLTDQPGASDWRQLGLQPIGYPVMDRSHAALGAAVERWAQLTGMGLLEHRQMVADLVSRPPSLVPEDMSYLDAVLSDPDRVQLFTDLARGTEWLRWASVHPEFQKLFAPLAKPTPCTGLLASWLAEHFVLNEDLCTTALELARGTRARLSSILWSAIGQQLHMLKSERPTWFAPWLLLLIENVPDWERLDWLDYALVASDWQKHRSEALLLFDCLTEPHLELQPSFGSASSRTDIRLKGSSYWLDQAWQSVFLPNLTDAASDVLPIADRHLRRAFHLLISSGSARSGWDPVAYSRSAIEPHEQDEHREPIDALIDAARDSLEDLLSCGHSLGSSYLKMWADSDVPLLRRLAVHGWSNRSDLDDTAKITWLRKQGWLFDLQLRHEVLNLIRVALPGADVNVADALVADALTGPANSDTEHGDYLVFNAVAWISRHAPELQSAGSALEQIRAQHSEFEEREHPDLESWMRFDFVPHQPPMSVDELHQSIANDALSTLEELRQYEGTRHSFDGPSWEDALQVLTETIRGNPADGFAVLDAPGGNQPDILGAVITGWSGANADAPTAEAILHRLAEGDQTVQAKGVADLLAGGGSAEANPTEWHRFSEGRELAHKVWRALDTEAADIDTDDWLVRAINHPAGKLAQFWIHAISADWTTAGESWAGLSPTITEQLTLMLDGNHDPAAMAQVVLASQVMFFFRADRPWCEAHILPLLDWADPARARRTWDGYLTWGRWNDQLLSAGLLDDYLAALEHRQEFGQDSRKRLRAHFAGIALTSELDPMPWIQRFTVVADPPDRVDWMNRVQWTLEQLPNEAAEQQWRRWMHAYWQGRLNGVPIQLTPGENSAMAAWTIYLTDSIPEAVNTATKAAAGIPEHSSILHQLNTDRLDRAPAEFAKLVAHLMKGTTPPFWNGHDLAGIVARLRQTNSDSADIDSVREEAMRLGIMNAHQW